MMSGSDYRDEDVLCQAKRGKKCEKFVFICFLVVCFVVSRGICRLLFSCSMLLFGFLLCARCVNLFLGCKNIYHMVCVILLSVVW